jgi:hypothetical protein
MEHSSPWKQRHHRRRLCIDNSREAGFEALFTAVSRAHFPAVPSLPQPQAAIGSYSYQTGFKFSSRFLVGPGKFIFCFIVIHIILHSLPIQYNLKTHASACFWAVKPSRASAGRILQFWTFKGTVRQDLTVVKNSIKG